MRETISFVGVGTCIGVITSHLVLQSVLAVRLDLSLGRVGPCVGVVGMNPLVL